MTTTAPPALISATAPHCTDEDSLGYCAPCPHLGYCAPCPHLGYCAPTPQVLADLPGLVAGASMGRGLGRQFLQQLRRVRLVLYVLDTTCTEVDVGEKLAA